MTLSDRSIADVRRKKIACRVMLLVFAAAAITFTVIPIINQARKVRHGENGTKDYPLWYETGYLELHGQSPYYRSKSNAPKHGPGHPDTDNAELVSNYIYHSRPGDGLNLKDEPDGEFPFMYPPGAAGLLAVLSLAGKWPTILFLIGLNTVAWATCILAPVWLLTGRIRDGPVELYWVPSLVCCIYIWDTYLEGQLAFVLSACLLGMFVCLRQKKAAAAGGLLALAAGFKAFPILALPYLIYRRHWKALGYTVLFLGILLFALPACFRGVHGAVDDLKVWKTGMMSPNTPERIGQREARSYTWQNGSILALSHRWLRPVVADHDDKVPEIWINVANLPFETINKIADGVIVALGIGYVVVTSIRRPRTAFRLTVEQSLLLILIVLCTPLSFTYNTSWMMCGIAAVLWFGLHPDRTRREKIVYITWMLAALTPLIFSVGNPHFRVVRAMGNTAASEFLLMAELCWMLKSDQDAR
jgi:hypothetical protein